MSGMKNKFIEEMELDTFFPDEQTFLDGMDDQELGVITINKTPMDGNKASEVFNAGTFFSVDSAEQVSFATCNMMTVEGFNVRWFGCGDWDMVIGNFHFDISVKELSREKVEQLPKVENIEKFIFG